MRVLGTLLALTLALSTPVQVHAGSGMDQLRNLVNNKLPRYGIRLTPEQLAAIPDNTIVQIDQTMGDGDLRQVEKQRTVKHLVNKSLSPG